MVKIQVNQQGKAYLTVTGKVLIASEGSGGKYSALQRIKDDSNNEIGTVSGFFTDSADNEYAVVCLDAQYRLLQGSYCDYIDTAVTDLPEYGTWGLWEAKETATHNTQKILDFCASKSATSSACSHCRSKSFVIDGVTYYGQLPNFLELVDICKNYTAIQAADTSVSQYSALGFPRTSDRVWCSTQRNRYACWSIVNEGSAAISNKAANGFVAPVLEIPNF